MAKRLGPRFGVEAGFLIAVAVALGLVEVAWPAIVGAMAIAWLVVAAVEIALARRPAPVAEPAAEEVPEPEPALEPEPAPTFALPAEPVHVPPVVAPPPPPVLEVELEPASASAAPPPAPEAREWNIWELERLARDFAGIDPVRDEERGFLLLSLRDHARPDGSLPAQFDQIVRDAFGDVLQTPA